MAEVQDEFRADNDAKILLRASEEETTRLNEVGEFLPRLCGIPNVLRYFPPITSLLRRPIPTLSLGF